MDNNSSDSSFVPASAFYQESNGFITFQFQIVIHSEVFVKIKSNLIDRLRLSLQAKITGEHAFC